MTVGELVTFLKLDRTDFVHGLGESKDAAKSFQQATNQAFKDFERGAKYVFAAVSIGIGLAVKKAVEFENQMAMINTALGRDSKVSLDVFRTGITAASKAFGESTKTLATGLYDILGAAVPAEEAMRVLEDSTRAAIAGFTDTGIAADAVTTIMNAYADTTYDSAYAFDVLFAAVIRGKMTFGDLASSVGEVASLAAQSGVSLEEMSASLAIATRAGIDTNTAVTNLKGVLTTLLSPTDELTEALGGLSVQNGDFLAIMERLSKLPPDVINKLFPNVRAMSGVITTAKEFGSELEIIHDMVSQGSPTMDAYNIAMDTADRRWKIFKETLNAAFVEIGTNLLPIFERLLGIVAGALDRFSKMSEAGQNLVLALAAIVASAFPLIKAVQAVIAIVNIAKVAWIALNATMLGTPIGLIVAGLAAITLGTVALVTTVKRRQEQEKQLSDDLIKGYTDRVKAVEDHNRQIRTEAGLYSEMTYWMGELASARIALDLADEAHRAERQAEYDTIQKTIAALKEKVDAEKAAVVTTEELTQGQKDFKAAADAMNKTFDTVDSLATVYGILGIEYDSAGEKQRAMLSAIDDLVEKGYKPEGANIQTIIDLYNQEGDVVEALALVKKDAAEKAAEEAQEEIDAIERRRLASEQFAEDYDELVEEQIEQADERREKEYEDFVEDRNRQYEEQIAHNQLMAEELDRAMMTERDRRIAELNDQYAIYQKAGLDRLKLDQWYAEQKKKIIKDTSTEEVKSIKDVGEAMKDLGKQILSTFSNQILGAIEQFGVSLGEGESAANAGVKSLRDLGAAILKALPKLLLMAGLQILPMFPPVSLVVGAAFIAAAGFASLVSGLVEGNINQQTLAEQLAADTAIDEEAAREEIRRALLTDRQRAMEDLEAKIAEFRAAGASEADIEKYRAQEMADIDERYPAMFGGGVVSGPMGIDRSIIRATPGEYVMPVQQTADNFELLEAMRSGARLSISAAPVVIELDGRVLGRGLIEYVQDEASLGAMEIDSRAVRPSK